MREIEMEEGRGRDRVGGRQGRGERETDSERCLLFVCEFLAV